MRHLSGSIPASPRSRQSRYNSRLHTFLAAALMSGFGALYTADAGNWSDPATWGGSVPVAGQNVTIPSGTTVNLDVSTPSLGLLNIEGTLKFNNANLNLTAKHILVHHGKLEVGTATTPFTANATITLTGADDTDYQVHGMSMGTKGLVVHGGTLDLHGSRKSAAAFTKLTANVSAGATSITVANSSTGWQVGDRIAIAPSGILPSQTEVRTITAISGSTITLNSALSHPHRGVTQTYGTKVLDERAEVALLSRNIVIQGDTGSSTSLFGAHVMVMEGSMARVEGVRFTRSGQKGKIGRYAFHWHLAGDGTGQYIRDCSIETSYRRGIVVHGTDSTSVMRNALYDIVDHSIVAEDGSEMFNVFDGNIVLYTKQKASEDIAPRSGSENHSEARPGSYWLRNPHNYVRNNVAAGGEKAIGFFYDSNKNGTPGVPFPGYESGTKVLEFTGNVAHSYNAESGGNDRYPTTSTGFGLFVFEFSPGSKLDSTFSNFVAYKNNIAGVWLEADHLLTGSILADNGNGVVGVSPGAGWTQRPHFVEDTVIIGQSGNTISNPTLIRGGILVDEDDQVPVQIKNVTFYDHAVAGIRAMTARKLPLDTWAENITATNTLKFKYDYYSVQNNDPNYPRGSDHNYTPTGYFLDKGGSISGAGADRHLIPRRPVEKSNNSATENTTGNYFVDNVAARVYLTISGSSDLRNGDLGTLATLTNEVTNASNPVAVHRSVRKDAFSYLPSGGRYRLGLTSVSASGTYRAHIQDGASGNAITLALPVTSGTQYVYYATKLDTEQFVSDAPDPWAPLTATTSVANVQSGSGNNYYHDTANSRVYIKLVQGARAIYVTNTLRQAGAKLTGTQVSNSGGSANKSKAFDGSFTTYYDATISANGWVGLDLGTAKVITRIRFAPRTGYASRMNDGRWYGSNSADFSNSVELFRWRSTATENAWTDWTVNASSTAYRYVRYVGPYGGWCNVSELEWYGF